MSEIQRILPQSSSKPMIPAIAPRTPQIIKGVPNPMTQISKDIVNSLYGTGSLNANSVHINSIQSNISRALSVSNEFSNKPAQETLLAAQASMKTAATARDAATRAAALATVKQALVTANNAISSLGYGKPTGQVAPINPRPVLTTASANRRIYL